MEQWYILRAHPAFQPRVFSVCRERYGQCENKNNVKTRKNNKAQIATDGKLFEVYKYHNSYFWP